MDSTISVLTKPTLSKPINFGFDNFSSTSVDFYDPFSQVVFLPHLGLVDHVWSSFPWLLLYQAF